ncbi:hypothetical protein FC54_GL001062 [Ligilactobacillus saerimneri DSM 16049]|nr:hypothetical protein FC54_GL001062 [Ligilactobacillus saerimneri DSM 16049]
MWIDDDFGGTLVYDSEQEAWVLWPERINDGVTYFDDLDLTQEKIIEEYKAWKKEWSL